MRMKYLFHKREKPQERMGRLEGYQGNAVVKKIEQTGGNENRNEVKGIPFKRYC